MVCISLISVHNAWHIEGTKIRFMNEWVSEQYKEYYKTLKTGIKNSDAFRAQA